VLLAGSRHLGRIDAAEDGEIEVVSVETTPVAAVAAESSR
jgi:hypothetical protein